MGTMALKCGLGRCGLAVMIACAGIFLLALCGRPALAAQKPLNIIATTGMIADAVREIGGDRVQVRALMGAGVDPHSFRQTRSDIVAMTRADLVFRHVHGAENKVSQPGDLIDRGGVENRHAACRSRNRRWEISRSAIWC